MDKHYKELNQLLKEQGYKTPYHFYSKCNFNTGNFFKYLVRHKHKRSPKEDLQKALNYFNGMVDIGLDNNNIIPINNYQDFEPFEDCNVFFLFNKICKNANGFNYNPLINHIRFFLEKEINKHDKIGAK